MRVAAGWGRSEVALFPVATSSPWPWTRCSVPPAAMCPRLPLSTASFSGFASAPVGDARPVRWP